MPMVRNCKVEQHYTQEKRCVHNDVGWGKEEVEEEELEAVWFGVGGHEVLFNLIRAFGSFAYLQDLFPVNIGDFLQIHSHLLSSL